jgi:hypothetical protein
VPSPTGCPWRPLDGDLAQRLLLACDFHGHNWTRIARPARPRLLLLFSGQAVFLTPWWLREDRAAVMAAREGEAVRLAGVRGWLRGQVA